MRALVLAALVACDQGAAPKPAPEPSPVPMPPGDAASIDAALPTCEDVRPQYMAIKQAQDAAFDAALRSRGFKPAKLQREWHVETREAQSKQVELIELTITHDGKRRRVITGPIYDRANFDDRARDVVVDADGNVWEATRQHQVTTTTTVSVQACEWGCFGREPQGEEPGRDLGRDVWMLGAKQTFKGEVPIEFSAPYFDIRYTRIDCPYPK